MEGYICDSTSDNMVVNINLKAGVTADQLEEAVYDLVRSYPFNTTKYNITNILDKYTTTIG